MYRPLPSQDITADAVNAAKNQNLKKIENRNRNWTGPESARQQRRN
jgi:hypothetical protein